MPTSAKPQAIEAVFTGEEVIGLQELVRQVPIAEDVVRYAVQIAGAEGVGKAAKKALESL